MEVLISRSIREVLFSAFLGAGGGWGGRGGIRPSRKHVQKAQKSLTVLKVGLYIMSTKALLKLYFLPRKVGPSDT